MKRQSGEEKKGYEQIELKTLEEESSKVKEEKELEQKTVVQDEIKDIAQFNQVYLETEHRNLENRYQGLKSF